MTYFKVISCLIIILLLPCQGNTKDYTSIYTMHDLTKTKIIYEKNLSGIWQEDLIDKLGRNYIHAARTVSLKTPIFGKRGEPFEFYAKPDIQEVTIPIFSVKFLDDIFVAMAYMDKRNCSKDPISDYAGMLRYKNESNLPNKKFPPPLTAVGLPSDAISDQWVYKASGNALKSTVFFLMAHELAHVIFSHRPYDQITSAEAQNQEIQADAFALDCMAKIGVAPIALGLFFTAVSRFESAPGDFATLSGYEYYLREHSTHPLSSTRLSKVSQSIRENADNFLRLERGNITKSQLIKLADEIQKIANILDDRAIREYQRHRSLTTSWDRIKSDCR